MLQVAIYRTVIEVVVIKIIAICIIVLGLEVAKMFEKCFI